MAFCVLVILLVSMATSSYVEGVDQQCDASADCVTTNPQSICLRPFTSTSCTKGICSCDSGLAGDNCTTLANNKKHNESCTQNSDCNSKFECTNNKCACINSTDIYIALTEMCVDPARTLYGEACTESTQCFNFGLFTEGMNCSTTCQCSTGFVYRSLGYCDMPHVGEACDASNGCFNTARPITDDASLQTEICNNGTCRCPSNSSQYTTSLDGTSYSYCLVTTTATLKADGTTCMLHNECASKICDVCPADATNTKRCLGISNVTNNDPNGNPATKVYGDACTESTQCYNIGGTTDGMTCSTTCQCATGYVHRSPSNNCGLPYVGEACEASPGCRSVALPVTIDDASQQSETCNNGTCKCPSDSSQSTTSLNGTSYSYCLGTTTSGVSGFQTATGILLTFVALKVILV